MATPSVKELIGSVVCGCGKIVNQFPVRGRLRKHCSDACRVKASEANRKEKIAKYQVEYNARKRVVLDRRCLTCNNALGLSRRKYCCNDCRPKPQTITGKTRQELQSERIANKTHTCIHCHKEYVAKVANRNKYCSRECSLKEKTRLSQLRIADKAAEPKYTKVYFVSCSCGKSVASKSTLIKFCYECQYKKMLDYQKQKYREDNPLELIEKECAECGVNYIKQSNLSSLFCSESCSTKHHKRRGAQMRRARLRGNDYESFSSREIFKRDKWMCKLCGIKTPSKLVGSNEGNAPTLDHIVPIAKGGPHTRVNSQCACRDCNSKKSDTIQGQMLLFG